MKNWKSELWQLNWYGYGFFKGTEKSYLISLFAYISINWKPSDHTHLFHGLIFEVIFFIVHHVIHHLVGLITHWVLQWRLVPIFQGPLLSCEIRDFASLDFAFLLHMMNTIGCKYSNFIKYIHSYFKATLLLICWCYCIMD